MISVRIHYKIIVKLVQVKDIIVIIQSQYIVKRMPAIKSMLNFIY